MKDKITILDIIVFVVQLLLFIFISVFITTYQAVKDLSFEETGINVVHSQTTNSAFGGAMVLIGQFIILPLVLATILLIIEKKYLFGRKKK